MTSTRLLDVALPVVFGTYFIVVGVYPVLQVLFAERVRRGGGRSSSSSLPSVDVVVPCYNERPEILSACLESLARQDYRGAMTIVIGPTWTPKRNVDQGSYCSILWMGKSAPFKDVAEACISVHP